MTAATSHVTGIRAVSIPVNDQDAALRFYTDTLGFKLLRDNPTPDGSRWIELTPGTDSTIVTLEPSPVDVTRGAISIRFATKPKPPSYPPKYPGPPATGDRQGKRTLVPGTLGQASPSRDRQTQ